MMRKFLLTAMVILLLLIAVTVVLRYLGSQLPENHIVIRSALFSASSDTVWAALTDFSAYSVWRKDVSAVETLPLQAGSPVWREYDNRGQKITFRASIMDPPRRLVIEIIDQDTPYAGLWEFFIEPLDEGSSVTITERGRIHHAIMRFIMHKVFSIDKTVKAYLRDLEKRLKPAGSQ